MGTGGAPPNNGGMGVGMNGGFYPPQPPMGRFPPGPAPGLFGSGGGGGGGGGREEAGGLRSVVVCCKVSRGVREVCSCVCVCVCV